MAVNRRLGVESSKTRAMLVEAAAQVMSEEGYVAVSARRVADRAGLKPQLVHYYFRTMDDLFLAVFRHITEQHLERHKQAVASERPVTALWELNSDSSGTVLTSEFLALANQRPAIREEIVRSAENFRAMQVEVLTKALENYGLDPDDYPPSALVVLMVAISRSLATETTLGVAEGHADLLALVRQSLASIEGGSRRKTAVAQAGAEGIG